MASSAVVVIISGILLFFLGTSEWGKANQSLCIAMMLAFMAIMVAFNLKSQFRLNNKREEKPQQSSVSEGPKGTPGK